ncbi:MAG: phosphoenolpyruvate mutase [Treponema sp.]|jgi:phosphoenolpyruvate phosphomutase|nr:phosphoenolpyruvate mutase [Treponema sp.]
MKTVYLGMTADIIHPGIVNILREASRYGRVLVGLLTDSAIAKYKRLPYLSYDQRKEVVESLKYADAVVPQEEWSYVPNLRRYRPDYIIHGDDWKTGILSKVREDVYRVMEELGGQVIEIPYTPGITSTAFTESVTSIGVTPDLRLKTLRRLIAAKPLVRIMEAHSGLSGLIVEHLELVKGDAVHRFDGMWSSSLTDSVSKGKPDIEAVDITTRLQDLIQILECTTKPVIFDGDTGGIAEHFVFTVRTLERNGISAVIIEDKRGLKKNSLFGAEVEQQLAPIEEFCEKIQAGKRAQVTREFMIIARLESLIAGFSVDHAMERALACAAAGADGIMIHSKERSGEDVKEFCRRFRGEYAGLPLVLVPTTYNHCTEAELASWGANIVIYANHLLRASYPAMLKAARTILEHERSREADEFCLSIKEILELIPGTR